MDGRRHPRPAPGLEIVESETIEQIEPVGNSIHPLWVFARPS